MEVTTDISAYTVITLVSCSDSTLHQRGREGSDRKFLG